jgi:hypothetical protein
MANYRHCSRPDPRPQTRADGCPRQSQHCATMRGVAGRGAGGVNSFRSPLGVATPCVYVRCGWCGCGGCGCECGCGCGWCGCGWGTGGCGGGVESGWCVGARGVRNVSSFLPLIALAVASASSYAGASGCGVVVIGNVMLVLFPLAAQIRYPRPPAPVLHQHLYWW